MAVSLPPPPKSTAVSLRTLRLIAIFAPTAVVAGIEFVRHWIFAEDEHMLLGNFALLAALLLFSYVFSSVLFGLIEKAQKEKSRRSQEMAALIEIALAVNESLDLQVVLSRALGKLIEITGASAGEILLREERSEAIVQRAYAGPTEGFFEKSACPMGQGFVGEVVGSGVPVIVEDTACGQWPVGRSARKQGFGSMVGVPLKSPDGVNGVIILAAAKRRHFTQDDTRLLENTGQQIAVAVENARLHEKVQGMAALEERERIAREMHDGLAQVLSYVDVKTQAARQLLAAGRQSQAEAFLKEMEEVARNTCTDVREAILCLRSTNVFRRGIVALLKEYIVRYNQMGKVKTELELKDWGMESLPAASELQVIRIIQECLTNVRKHAGAAHAWVRISTRPSGEAEIVVEDDGQGFDVTRIKREGWARFGLQSMKERAESVGGTLEIASTPGKGTRTTLTVPLARRTGNEGAAG